MESQNDRSLSEESRPIEEPQQAEPTPPPKKRFQLKRFQIVKLEERVTPGHKGWPSGSGETSVGGYSVVY